MKLIAKEVDPRKTLSSIGQEVIVDDLGFDFSVIHKKVKSKIVIVIITLSNSDDANNHL